MTDINQIGSEELKIQKLLAGYLQSHSQQLDSKPHLDEDSLNAFVEGRLSPVESPSVLKHLTGCSFCLHMTAELAMLDSDLAGAASPNVIVSEKPQKLSEVLQGLLSKIFDSSDGAVFAHQENKQDGKEDKENKEDKEKD